ncbi:DNA-processing protein DprA [Priestia aryabhattai]|uniref:DNA-processing protein DprA n=1 Tax=Priestia aryabhattai TaxID=412384 RepID=A0AAX6ND67_PRIAR|nr:DNA-processing protein DprA [Priestia aryabhattai]MDU9693610.1 DNA-processing protein DprA [Priestia aryabhattai]
MIVAGTLQEWNKDDLVAIIGPRKASKAECMVAYLLAKKCAEKGKIVVSGLAEGIDTYAHRGALDGGGQTIAILSTSIDENIFPSFNEQLAEDIKKKGSLMHLFELSSRAADKKFGKIKHEKPRYILRLLERDIYLAYICPTIIAVSNKRITGGTRWGVNYGLNFNKEVWQYNNQGKPIPLNYSKAEVDWKLELNNLL